MQRNGFALGSERQSLIMMQNYLLIFLCVLVFLTVLSVLWANLANPSSETGLAWFARWGAGFVLVEIIGLFALVSKYIMTKDGEQEISLFIFPKEPFVSLNPIWDVQSCRISGDNGELVITGLTHGTGGTLEVPLSVSQCSQISDGKPLLIKVKDNKGIEWSSSFHLSRLQSRVLPDIEKSEVELRYRSDDE